MRIALDTNRYVVLCRAVTEVVDWVARADAIYLPFVVVAELRAGFACGKAGQANAKTLTSFLAQPGVSVLYPTDATTVIYAHLYRQLRAQGTPIPTNDLWIAALASEHNLILLTRDEHFGRLPQLRVLE